MIIVYPDVGKSSSKVICRLFAQGFNARLIEHARRIYKDKEAAIYGITPNTLHLWRQINRCSSYYYMDNAYFSRGHYFRITKNKLQHSGVGPFISSRLERHSITIKPWRKTGEFILICPQTDYFGEVMDFNMTGWVESTINKLRRYTDRPIIIRHTNPSKKFTSSIPQAAEEAWAIVSYSSNALVEGILAGVPAFCGVECAASSMGNLDFSKIENPRMPAGRYEWACVLASNQWSRDEIGDGTAKEWFKAKKNIEYGLVS